MKFLLVAVFCVALVQAGRILENIGKYIPSFPTGFIVNGREAAPHSAPFIVSIRKSIKHKHFCGGSIIDMDWIVTAAHCIRNPVNLTLIAGLHESFDLNNNTQIRYVDWGKVHENYTSGVGPYDIAVLHLSEPFVLSEYVQPAILPEAEKIPIGEAHLYGWGKTSSFDFTLPKILQTVQMEILDFDDCQEALPKNSPLHESNVCSSSTEKGISACNGDSGGPLVMEHEKSQSELIGIVSWGFVPCGSRSLPSIYTRVSAYIDWIKQMQNEYTEKQLN